MAEAAFKSLTDVVTALQQKVELKTIIQKISPHDFGHKSVSFAGNHLEDSKVFRSRFNDLALLKNLKDTDKLKVFPLALSDRAYQWSHTLAPDTNDSWAKICEQFNITYGPTATSFVKQQLLLERTQGMDEIV